jgi:hypothetical protein
MRDHTPREILNSVESFRLYIYLFLYLYLLRYIALPVTLHLRYTALPVTSRWFNLAGPVAKGTFRLDRSTFFFHTRGFQTRFFT